MNARNARHGCGLLAAALLGIGGVAAQNVRYEPTLESLRTRADSAPHAVTGSWHLATSFSG